MVWCMEELQQIACELQTMWVIGWRLWKLQDIVCMIQTMRWLVEYAVELLLMMTMTHGIIAIFCVDRD